MAELPRPEPSRRYRWMVLIVISLAMFGNYYVYDCIAPIADLLSKQLGFSDSNIGLLQAIYSIPNVIMVLIGGYIVDRIGTRKAIFIFGIALPDRCGRNRTLGQTGGNGIGTADLWPRRRVANRGRHYGDREMVPRQGTEFRLRHQPHDRAARDRGWHRIPRPGPIPLTATGGHRC